MLYLQYLDQHTYATRATQLQLGLQLQGVLNHYCLYHSVNISSNVKTSYSTQLKYVT